MTIPYDLFVKLVVGPVTDHINSGFCTLVGAANEIWLLSRSRSYAVTTDLTAVFRDEYPWMAHLVDDGAKLLHHRLHVFPADLPEFYEWLQTNKEPGDFEPDESLVLGELVEGNNPDGDPLELSDAERESLGNALASLATAQGVSSLIGGVSDVVKTFHGEEGVSVERLLGQTAIDAEVEGFRAEMDSALDDLLGGGDSR